MNIWRQFVIFFIYFCVEVVVFREYILVEDFSVGELNPGDVISNSENQYGLVVGILSSRSNLYLRESLRKTWVGHAKNQKERMLVKFIISDQPCLIPPEYRTNPYQCEEKIMLHDIVFERELIAYSIPLHVHSNYTSSSPIGRDFSVVHPIVITHLGLFENGLDENIDDNTTVRLYDKITKKEVVSANFSMDNHGSLINGSWFKIVLNFVLPKDFQASIVSENFNYADHMCAKPEGFVEIQEGGGLIKTHQIKRFDDDLGIFPEKEETVYNKRCPYPPGTFMYHAHVPGDSSRVPSNQDKELRFKEWRKLKDEENTRLLKESQRYQDILLVPNIDVYRNLPSQLLEFFRWVSKNTSFSFLLKTDDDCFVDVDAILKAINDHKLVSKSKVWWSRFRTNWLVDRVGKWAEPDYPGETYPSFACGAGYVLSADLVDWLARNADSLKRYQGEDVSMGIWLSAVGPNILKDQRWSCFQECFQGMFTSPEHDTESLYELWENFQSCGNPCSC